VVVKGKLELNKYAQNGADRRGNLKRYGAPEDGAGGLHQKGSPEKRYRHIVYPPHKVLKALLFVLEYNIRVRLGERMAMNPFLTNKKGWVQ